MQYSKKTGYEMKELQVKNGYLVCPVCRRQKHLQKVNGNEYIRNAELFCNSCKSKVYVDIIGGKCYSSSGIVPNGTLDKQI